MAEAARGEARQELQEQYFLASQWQLMWRKLRRHRLALAGATMLALLYLVAIFAEFFAPHDLFQRHNDFINAPPVLVRVLDEGSVQMPFVYPLVQTRNEVTLRREYAADTTRRLPLVLFVRGDPYKLWGIFRTDVHFFGTRGGEAFLLGTDRLGRDMLSRVIHGARISLSIGLVGVFISFVLGCILGGISGYYGGTPDLIVQRAIEFIISIPTIPLWMALSAALPADWPALRVYFAITVILALQGWAGLARVVRGKLLELREEDFVMAARIAGQGAGDIIRRHLLPSFMSYLIVNITLAIPGMILGETALSFLGLGLRPPVVSWGVLLKDAQNFRTVAIHPWLLIPGIFVIVTVLMFNFLGDGLRDAADPYTSEERKE
ncbi:MAG: ABC transporter permease [Spirochaetaceae bacterium]|nr:ABC transporter permease [Spirochaetaceae bacterium]